MSDPAGNEDPSDWRWRRRIRSNAHTYLLYRVIVGTIGVLVTVLGLILVPFPGPGWLIVLTGLLILASEFAWAHRLMERVRRQLHRWNERVQAQSPWVRVLLAVLTGLFVLAVVWASLALVGLPSWVPQDWATWLHRVPGW